MSHLKYTIRLLCVTLLGLALVGPGLHAQAFLSSIIPSADAGRPTEAADDDREDNDDDHEAGRRSDPCALEPRGEARGRRRRCPPRGSSSGIARGDFNGDGIGDLAIGIPFEDISGKQDAGAVNVIYGSVQGLSADAGPSDQFFGYTVTNARAGSALAAGDFDGDGYSDLAIGAPFDDVPNAPTASQPVPFVYSNIAGGSSDTVDTSDPATAQQQNGISDAGRVHIFYGSPAGLDLNTWQPFSLAQVPGNTPNPLDEFGSSLAWGDFDGNSKGDLAVGIPGHNLQAGAVGIFYGSLRNNLSQVRQLWTQASVGIADTAESGDRFGATLAAGEFGISANANDLAIGVPGEDVDIPGRTGNVATVRDAGAVSVIYGGSASGLTAAESQFWTQNSEQIEAGEIADIAEEDDRFGSSLASFGLGGSDLAIGVPGEDVRSINDAGAVNVIYFNAASNKLSVLNNQIWSQASANVEDDTEPDDQFGFALAGGDFNGDSLKDLAIGAPGETLHDQSAPVSNAGAVNVIYYHSIGTGLNATAGPGDQFWTQDSSNILNAAEPGDRFGSALTAWDFGNGFQADLAIGVPFQAIRDFSAAGAVHVIYADSTTFLSGLSATGNQFWTQASTNIEGRAEVGDQFGRAVY